MPVNAPVTLPATPPETPFDREVLIALQQLVARTDANGTV